MVSTAARLHHRTILRIEGQAGNFHKYLRMSSPSHFCSRGSNGDGLFPQSPPHKYTLVVICKMGDIPIHRQKHPAAKVDSSIGKAKKQARLTSLHSKPTSIHLLNFTRSSRTSILASSSTTLGARFSITLLQSMTYRPHLSWNRLW